MRQCQGGWCVKRDKCPHYTAPRRAQEPADRLCLPGRDGVRMVESTPFVVRTVYVFAPQELELA